MSAKSKSFLKSKVFLYLLALIIISAITFYRCGSIVFDQNPEPNNPVEEVPDRTSYTYDIVIYGGTPAGAMAAVSASREGAKVAVIEPNAHLGGMITGGLCYSDMGNSKVVGGLAREFFERTGAYYGRSTSFAFEPHVAEQVMSDMISESGVDVYTNHRLKEHLGVEKSGSKIVQILTENEDGEAIFEGDMFIDCSYEGDLMAQAGVSYTYGRESSGQYQEYLAGVRPEKVHHIFKYDISAYDENGNLLPEISSLSLDPAGEGDKKIPAYNFRLCLSDDPENQTPFTAPPGYDPSRYRLLLNWLNILKHNENNRDLVISDVMFLGELPGNKADANNSGPFSTNFIGGSWYYPDADYSTREEIKNQCKAYIQGFLYFLTTDENVPDELQTALGRWGLASDEFVDNDNWPYQMYIRESRRMVSEYVMAQRDLIMGVEIEDSVGMGSYSIDSHNTQRYVTEDGFVQNEGDVQVHVPPYQIPYRIIVPGKSEAENLIVPVCMSASHVAYSSLRMEPQYMILGQAAGISAKIAIDSMHPVQDIDIDLLQKKLRQNKAILSYPIN